MLSLINYNSYFTLSLGIFTLTCGIDATRSLIKYKKNRDKKYGLDFEGFWGSWNSRASEFDAMWYGMNPVNNFFSSLVFPYHLVTLAIPCILYKVYNCKSEENKKMCYVCRNKENENFDCSVCGKDHQKKNMMSSVNMSANMFMKKNDEKDDEKDDDEKNNIITL